MLVVVDEPRPMYYGSAVAGPAVRKMMGILLAENGNRSARLLEAALEALEQVPMIERAGKGKGLRWGPGEWR
ncbi:MAG: hypothetical protein ACE5GW_05165 [Planctomycetota bacterium]